MQLSDFCDLHDRETWNFGQFLKTRQEGIAALISYGLAERKSADEVANNIVNYLERGWLYGEKE
jgi:hypothetical protein